MSHAEQLAFFSAVSVANPLLLDGARILEIGSYDVNGSMRGVFSRSADYVGVDLVSGPGVDRVVYGHEVAEPDGSYDAVLSGECFEHDPHFHETFANMVRLTRPGGLVAFTCASRGRPEHGTRRTLVSDSPGSQAEGHDYYRNVTAADFDDVPLDEWFTEHSFWYQPTTFDLYFAGIRTGAGEPQAKLPAGPDVAAIRRLMTFPHRAVRWPLRAALATVGDGDRYQSVVLPYWTRMIRWFG